MIEPAYSVSFLLSINIFVWKNVLYFLDAPRTCGVTKNRLGKSGEPSVGDTGAEMLQGTSELPPESCYDLQPHW